MPRRVTVTLSLAPANLRKRSMVRYAILASAILCFVFIERHSPRCRRASRSGRREWLACLGSNGNRPCTPFLLNFQQCLEVHSRLPGERNDRIPCSPYNCRLDHDRPLAGTQDALSSRPPSRLLKFVFERGRCATLIQEPGL